MNFLFGEKKKDPAELAKEWKRNLQKEARTLDRDILNLGREEQKALKECKKLAKEGNVKSAKILAKEVVNTRNAVARMHTAKAQMNSVSMMLQTSASAIKMQGCIAKSADIMAAMNHLVKLPEIRETMTSMSREMMRAGLVEEMISDTMEALDSEGIESEADKEVDKIILELTAGVLGGAAAAPTTKISGATAVSAATAVESSEAAVEDTAADEAELHAMQQRLQSL